MRVKAKYTFNEEEEKSIINKTDRRLADKGLQPNISVCAVYQTGRYLKWITRKVTAGESEVL